MTVLRHQQQVAVPGFLLNSPLNSLTVLSIVDSLATGRPNQEQIKQNFGRISQA